MIVTDDTYKKEYSKLVFGIFTENTTNTMDFYLYDDENGKNILIEGNNIAITGEWMQIKCEDASIDWTTLDGETIIDLGSWDGYRKIEIKITIPENVDSELFNFTMTSSEESITAQFAINYEFDLFDYVGEQLFGE